MSDTTNSSNGNNGSHGRLPLAQGAASVRSLPPLDEDLPASRKVLVGELGVPQREITLSNGETVRVYDTTGPQGHDVRQGLPRLRQPWIDRRVARGDQNFSQMHCARRGEITEEMRFCAIRENVTPE